MSDETPKEETTSEEAEAQEAPAEAVAEEAAGDTTEAQDSSAEEAAPESEPAVEEPAATEAAAEPAAEPAAQEAPASEEAAAEAEPVAEEPAAPAADATSEEAPAAPDYSYDDLHGKNVAELREIAATIEHDAVHGYTTMHKEHLVPAICQALGIEAHEHHEVVGIDKESIKVKIRQLKAERDAAESAGDKVKLKILRRRIRGLKRKIRKATV